MILTRINAPQVPPLLEFAAWDFLRIPLSENGAPALNFRKEILRILEGAINEFDGPEGYLSRAIFTQTWSLFLDEFSRVIELPLPPCQAVTFVKYLDENGAWQTLDSSSYRVTGINGSAKAEIAPAFGKAWPNAQPFRDSIEVRFVAGYGSADSDVPAAIRAAILEIVATRFHFREQAVMGGLAYLPANARASLDNFRIW